MTDALKIKRTWQNRIVGYSEEAPDQLLASPWNWRVHPRAQQDVLAGALEEVGLVQNIVCNRTTGHIIDGHLRVALALRSNQPLVPVTWVELTEQEEKLILATFDPISAMANSDSEMLEQLLSEVDTVDEHIRAMLDGMGAGDDGLYSRKIEAPIYEPNAYQPEISELYDDSKTQRLVAQIDASDLPDEVKAFLRIAAQRHTVLNFKRIADYYAHASEDEQALMEASALVIIDFDKAIEYGFVQLTERIAGMVANEYG